MIRQLLRWFFACFAVVFAKPRPSPKQIELVFEPTIKERVYGLVDSLIRVVAPEQKGVLIPIPRDNLQSHDKAALKRVRPNSTFKPAKRDGPASYFSDTT